MCLERLPDAVVCSFKSGEYLIYPEEALRFVYYLVSGSCIGVMTNENGNEYLQNEVVAGSGINSVAALGMIFDNDHIAPMGLVALTDITAWKIPVPSMLDYLRQNPDEIIKFTSKLMHNYVDIIRRYNFRCETRTIDRLSQYILERSEDIDGRLVFPKCYSNQELAKLMGVHPVTLSRMLTALKEQGYIAKTSAGWEIRNLDGLIACAQGTLRVQYRQSM